MQFLVVTSIAVIIAWIGLDLQTTFRYRTRSKRTTQPRAQPKRHRTQKEKNETSEGVDWCGRVGGAVDRILGIIKP
jgi:hypothetical protein